MKTRLAATALPMISLWMAACTSMQPKAPPAAQSGAVSALAAPVAPMAAAAGPGIAALTGHTNRVHSLAFSPDGAILASGSYDGTVRLWDMATHRQVAVLNGHGAAQRGCFRWLKSGPHDCRNRSSSSHNSTAAISGQT